MVIKVKVISKALKSALSIVKQVKTYKSAYQMLIQKRFGVNQVNNCT